MGNNQEILPPDSIVADKFRIIEYIGSGSLGDEIYHGVQTNLNREVQLKLISRDATEDEEIVQRFLQSINLTASLVHPNILPVYEADCLEDKYYVATAWKNTNSLKAILSQKNTFTEKEAIKIILDVISALDYAWDELQIIHRNLTPETIQLMEGGKPLIEDFGMAKVTDSQSSDLTMTGFTIGNPEYMSPEQVQGERDLDFRVDMYCLGLVFYEMLTGKYPFQAKSQMDYMTAHVSKTPIPVREENVLVRKHCSDVVDQMLAKDRNERFVSWKKLSSSLQNVYEGRAPDQSVKDAIKEIKAEKRAKAKANPEFVQALDHASKQKKQFKMMLVGVILIVVIILAIVFGFVLSKML